MSKPRQRSWLEVRWRRLRNPPPPVTRAVLADLAIAVAGGVVLLIYQRLNPDADLALPIALFVFAVALAGSALTYLWVELPSGAGGTRRRSAWAALLGLFASVPIAYLVLVLVFQVLQSILD